MRVFLIGFMCSGKSRIGKTVAPKLGLPFLDIDRMIEARIGPITPFFLEEGEDAFRKVEVEVLDELISGPDALIATGGGTPTVGDNMLRMKTAGTVVHLDTPMDILLPRIERTGGDRPLLFGLKGQALHDRVVQLMEARRAIYAEADLTVMNDATPEQVALRVAEGVRAAQVR